MASKTTTTPLITPRDYPIKDGSPGISPTRVVFREITFFLDRDGLKFVYYDPQPAETIAAGTIEAYVNAKYDEPIYSPSPPFTSTTRKETPIDLNISQASYVVFRLDRRWNWQFSSNATAIAHKEQGHGGHYGSLKHMITKTNKKPGSVPPGDGCQIIYFVANPPPNSGPMNPYYHKMNLYVDFLDKPFTGTSSVRVLPIIIDPDIRNPGGSPT